MIFSSPIPALMAMQMNKSSSEDIKKTVDSVEHKKNNDNKFLSFYRPFIWVRSSDKCSLFSVFSFEIRSEPYFNNSFIFSILDVSSNKILGRYSSLNYACKILDDIQCFISSCSNGIFDMPDDNFEDNFNRGLE